MATEVFQQLYLEALTNLTGPKDPDLEGRFLQAQKAVADARHVREKIQEGLDDLRSIAVDHRLPPFVVTAQDPLGEATERLEDRVALYRSLKMSGQLSISDVAERCFAASEMGAIHRLADAGRKHTEGLRVFCSLVLVDLPSRLRKAERTFSGLGARIDSSLYPSCKDALEGLKAELNSRGQSMSFSDAVLLMFSAGVSETKHRFDELDSQCRRAEKEHALREAAAREAAAQAARSKKEEELRQQQKLQAEWQLLQEKRRQTRLANERQRVLLEQEAAKRQEEAEREAKRKDDIAKYRAHLSSLGSPITIMASVGAAVLGTSVLYFLVSDFSAFDAAFIAAVGYMLFGIFEVLSKFSSIRGKDQWLEPWLDIAPEGLGAYTAGAMIFQLLGGAIYSVWNWFSPIEVSWIGSIFPHTWKTAAWYLLVAPLSIICIATIPAAVYRLALSVHAKRRLKHFP